MKTIQGPRGRLYLDHKPETVCLLGMGPSIQTYQGETMTQELKPDHHDEVWAINMTANCFRSDLVFWMDDLEHQSKLTPHFLIPTANMRATMTPEFFAPAMAEGGDALKALIDRVQSLPDWARKDEYEYCVEEFKTLCNTVIAGVPYRAVSHILSKCNADAQQAVQDKERSLAGLIQKLDSINVPVYTSKRYPDLVKNSLDYPLDEIAELGIKRFGKPYMNNGVAQAVAYAMFIGVKKLKIYGADFTYPNRSYAEGGRACVEAWVTYATDPAGTDMEVHMCRGTSLFDMVGDVGMYGYAEQPEIHLSDGKKVRYGVGQSGMDFTYLPPDTTNTHLKPSMAGADSVSGPNYPMVPRHVEVAQVAVQ